MQVTNEFQNRLEEMLEKEFESKVEQMLTCETHQHSYLKGYIKALREVGEMCKQIASQIHGA